MALIQSGKKWQFRTESDLEEVVWRHLPELLNLKPLSRQFSIDGKFCDILAIESSDRLAIIELKNTEDRYVVQQLVRYYAAIKAAGTQMPIVDITKPIRLIAIAPSFHADTLTDCEYSTLNIELLTFSLEPSPQGVTLAITDVAGRRLSSFLLPPGHHREQPDVPIPEPPRKLLNWLSHSSDIEHDWVLHLRKQLMSFDSRMKEKVEANRILYGRGDSKPCCELKKNNTGGLTSRKISCFLWLPDPENNPHVIKMLMNFDLEKQNVRDMHYGKKGYKSGSPWQFPKCIERMKQFGYRRALEQYQPFVEANMTIVSSNIVNLALKTWYSRL